MVFHNAQQKWYYLSGQSSSELLVFRQADTEGSPGTAFRLFPNRLALTHLYKEFRMLPLTFPPRKKANRHCYVKASKCAP